MNNMFNSVRRLILASLPLLATLTMGMGALSAHAQTLPLTQPANKVAPVVKTGPGAGPQKVVRHAHHTHHKVLQNKAGAHKTGTNKAGANKAGANKAGANKTGANKTGANKTGTNNAAASKTGASKTGTNNAIHTM